MRLFVGLEVPPEVKANLLELTERLRPAARLRWSSVDNLHITTKFIGEWPEARLPEMKSALSSIVSPEISITIRGLGWFPNPHSPRVFFAAVHAPESLTRLAAVTDDATAILGVKKEERRYSPHLTLARIQDSPDLAELRRAVASLQSDDFGSFNSSEFHVYLSRQVCGASVYTKLASFPLGSIPV